MFYLDLNTETTIYINRTFDTSETYTLTFKHKDELNVEYDFNLIPATANERYSTFEIDLVNTTLKEGTYKFYIYDDTGELQYNDISYVNFADTSVKIEDTTDKKIIID